MTSSATNVVCAFNSCLQQIHAYAAVHWMWRLSCTEYDRECQKFVQSREHQKSPQNYDLDTFSSRFQILGFRLVICAEAQNSGFEARHVNTHDVMMTLVSKESADQGLFKSTSFINFRGGGRKLEIFRCEIFVSRN
jgi:hypothetical protein